ncbi:LysR family transcriptional regulator [Salipiger mucosus]|uniref:LysR family transcriptional regulator clustered with dicarboxylate transport n=1 Tax=Salipiger mucosus DSM 16094 TaxID=1123237 RepID=S9Q7J4_9RHOB|nr:LysR family transcriptional regulator [Salipiger mucosus]EPX75568.1 LysR family transcriptional regulator clustered with dicarboxylate transport [Salipiger mucosus DSM 16094]
MDVSLRQIRSFLAVARLGSFTRAADRLALTQPTLTVQIRKLEEALEVRLFDRSTRRVTPTRVARSLIPVFERMVGDLDSVIAETRDIAAIRRGTVRVAVLPSVAAGLLPRAVRTFRAAHPGAAFVVRDLVADRIVEELREGSVDIGITGGPPVGSDIELLHRETEGFKAIFPADHPLAGLDTVDLAAVAEFPLVALDRGTSVRPIVERALDEAGLSVTTACEATYMTTVAGMVSAGLGVAILPAASREDRAFPDLRSAPVEAPGLRRDVSVIRLRGTSLPPMSAVFCDHLIATMTGAPA